MGVIKIDPTRIRLEEFMKALGQEWPVYADGDLRRYNAPYRDDKVASLVVNIRTNQWRDIETGHNGGIYDLAYEMTNSCNMSELNNFIRSEYAKYDLKRGKKILSTFKTENGETVESQLKKDISGDWLVLCKIGNRYMRPKIVNPFCAWKVINSEMDAESLLEKYYPEEMKSKIGTSIDNPAGTIQNILRRADYPFKFDNDITVERFRLTTDNNLSHERYGELVWEAVINGKKHYSVAEDADLKAAIYKTMTVKDLFSQIFGAKFHLSEHYRGYKLPEDFATSKIKVNMTRDSKPVISLSHPDYGETKSRVITYDDYVSYKFSGTATKEQLAAKYLLNDMAYLRQKHITNENVNIKRTSYKI